MEQIKITNKKSGDRESVVGSVNDFEVRMLIRRAKPQISITYLCTLIVIRSPDFGEGEKGEVQLY